MSGTFINSGLQWPDFESFRFPPPQGLISSTFGEVTIQTFNGTKRVWDYRKVRKWGLLAGAVAGMVSSLAALTAAGSGSSVKSHALRVGSAVLGIQAGAWLRQHFDAASTNPQIEGLVASCKDMEDATTVEGTAATLANDATNKVARVVRDWVDRAYAHFGRRLEDTKADRDALGFWLARQMKDASVRDRDIACYLPLIVEACLLPGYAELVAQEMRNSRVAKILKKECHTPKA